MLPNSDLDLESLLAEFLRLPSVRSTRVLVALYGAPCTGKTTLGNELSRQLGAYRISIDLLRARLVPNHLPKEERYAPHLNKELFDLFARFTRGALIRGTSIICESLLINPDRHNRLLSIAAETSTTVHTFFLNAPLEVLEERLALRERDGVNSEGLPETNMGLAILHRLNRLCRPHPGTTRVFDTHLWTSSEIVREIITTIHSHKAPNVDSCR